MAGVYCKIYTIVPTVVMVSVCTGATSSYVEGTRTKNGTSPGIAVVVTGKVSFPCGAFSCAPNEGKISIERHIELAFKKGLKWLKDALELEAKGKLGVSLSMKSGSAWDKVDVTGTVYGSFSVSAFNGGLAVEVKLEGGLTLKDFDFTRFTCAGVSVTIKFVASLTISGFAITCTVVLMENGSWRLGVKFGMADARQLLEEAIKNHQIAMDNMSPEERALIEKLADNPVNKAWTAVANFFR